MIDLSLNRGDALELEIDRFLHVADRPFNRTQSIWRRRVLRPAARFARGSLTRHGRDYRDDDLPLSRGTNAEVAIMSAKRNSRAVEVDMFSMRRLRGVL